ncbi:GyrI-like domain-containing protein [Microbacterium sp. RD1]|uniref:GyrI-like domain-containing protein n=1 Tax=Microbacterium sp. RD1 TaxID=3457313 RepID=UPI003FA5CCD1
MTKADPKKDIPAYRARSGVFDVVDVPPMRYLMIDGAGDPNTAEDYLAALQTIYPVAYKLKFRSKRDLERDYVVPPLEALWDAADRTAFTTARDKSQWTWTLLNLVPEWVTDDLVAAARRDAADAPSIERLRVGTLDEGTCVQTLHIGSYDEEAAVLARMHDEVIPARGLRMTGTHHEIYLSDPRRTEPAKLRTVLRQPVAPA